MNVVEKFDKPFQKVGEEDGEKEEKADDFYSFPGDSVEIERPK